MTLYALRASAQATAVGYTWLSREWFMLVNNFILVVSLAVVLWGTLAPIGYEAFLDGRISIGKPFFNSFFVPLMLVLAAAVALVPLLNWKRTAPRRLIQLAGTALLLATVLGGISWYLAAPSDATVLVALALAFWVVTTHVYDLIRRGSGVRQLPLAYWGMTLAHLGFAMSLIGVAVTSTQSIEEDVRMAPQDAAQLGDAQVNFLGVTTVQGPNYRAQQGIFVVTEADGERFELRPEKRRYHAGGNVMTEAGIEAGFWADTYVSLGEPLEGGAWAVRLHHKPLVRWVWLGALLMALGGALAVKDRRYQRLRERQTRRQVAPSGDGLSVAP